MNKKECKHDFKNYTRLWRANFICPKCKQDITLEIVFMYEALNNNK